MTEEFKGIDGEPVLRKVAVIFFNKADEPQYQLKYRVSQQIGRACGECIDKQVLDLSGADKPVVVDLTVVADCMYSAQAGSGYPPRGLYVSARNDLCPGVSAGSAACSGSGPFEKRWAGLGKYGNEVDGDGVAPAQAFQSGHVIANVRYDYEPASREKKLGVMVRDKVQRFQLFYSELPNTAAEEGDKKRKREGGA